MKNTTKSALALRAHSIRTLTPGELRVVNGGACTDSCKCCSARTPGEAGK